MVRDDAEVRIHNKLEGLTEAWDTIGATRESPMQHFIWSQACAETFRAAGQLQFFSVGSDTDLTALAPLIKRNGIFSRLEMIGVRELYEPMDFLYSDPSSLDALARKLVKRGDALLLQRMPADSPAITAIQKAFRGLGLVHILPADPYPYIELNSEWMAPESCFNAGRRSDFRRAQRQAAQLGEVKYEILSPAPAEVDSLLEEAYRIELASWKGEAGTALAVDPVRGAFYRHYALAASERGILRLVFLRIDGQAAGMQIAIESDERFWLLKIGHDNRFSKCSPGTLLMLCSLRYAANCGLKSYEFLGIAEPWTRNWTDLSRTCIALRAYPVSLGGLAVLSYDAAHFLRSKIKRFLQRNGGEK